jgi:antitoxin PrlF
MGYYALQREMQTSKVTSKYQTTIPAEIRKKLGIQGGDTLAFEVINDEVRLRRATPLDIQCAQALADTLNEWSSDNDAEAYREL